MKKIVCININKSGATELSKLPNIGLKKATALVLFRQKNGLFTSFDQLLGVSGINTAILKKITGLIML